jgi:hypothetical protein
LSKSLYPIVKERQTGAGKSNKTGREISIEILPLVLKEISL